MPRPGLGTQAKNVTACVKITETERKTLVARYGSVGKGLRALLDRDPSLADRQK